MTLKIVLGWLEVLNSIIAVSVTWNGTTITGPILIYRDEILSAADTVENRNDNGELVCRSENHEAAHWRNPRGKRISQTTTGGYQQVQSPAGLLPSLSRLSTIEDDPEVNGLCVCVLFINVSTVGGLSDQDLIDSFVYVGIYNSSRNSGELTDAFLRLD